MPTISEQIHLVGRGIISGADESNIANRLNTSIQPFVSPAFKCITGRLIDMNGITTDVFSSVIYTAFNQTDPVNGNTIPADNAAVVIDTVIDMGLEEFRASYARVSQAKRLAKAERHTTDDQPSTTVTLGIIYALKAKVPLEVIAEELNRLNSDTLSSLWPDMIVFPSSATINYTIQFPTQKPAGDFLPPAIGATQNYIPACYVQISLRPAGDFAFNKMMAFLVGHLNIFFPQSVPINFSDVLVGVTTFGITFAGYQFNLAGDLKPVPESVYNDRYLPPSLFLIESGKKVLATVQFLPWQDGGVILLNGLLPLEGILVFMNDRVDLSVIKLSDHIKVSNVLPISAQDFGAMLSNLQSRSNMTVRPDTRRRIMQKMADEGSSSLFIARLFLGIMRMRDLAINTQSEKDDFDNQFEFVHSNLLNARVSAEEIKKTWDSHKAKIASGEIITVTGRDISISENIDRNLKRDVESFLNAATRSLKGGMDKLTEKLGINIGFLFAKQATFEREIALFEQRDPVLAGYIRNTRKWSEPLILCRNDLEHNSALLSRVGYDLDGSNVLASEPMISGEHITKFTADTLDHLSHFVEDITAYCLQRKMPQGITLTEIPLNERKSDCPERFMVAPESGGRAEWILSFPTQPFDQV